MGKKKSRSRCRHYQTVQWPPVQSHSEHVGIVGFGGCDIIIRACSLSSPTPDAGSLYDEGIAAEVCRARRLEADSGQQDSRKLGQTRNRLMLSRPLLEIGHKARLLAVCSSSASQGKRKARVRN